MKSPRLTLLAAGLFTVATASLAAADFSAYYTHLQSPEAFERYSRTGDDADVAVQLGAPAGRLVFWRGSSYLPYWETAQGRWYFDEIIPRHGDGSIRQPDRVNVFSHVAIVENTSQRVLVYWRYLPQFEPGNPAGGLDPTRFAEEYFSIAPDGRVTRIIKTGTARIDDWNDPLNQTTQVLQLAADGVKGISRQAPAHSPPAGSISGNPLRGKPVVAPVCEWRFDEAVGDEGVESVTGMRCPIAGPKALWKKGVSGTALEFDGYNTVVALPAAKAPALSGGSLTLEAWFALGAYPWNWAPLVQQGDNDGYFLGVDSHGYPGFMLKVDGRWEELTVPNHPPYTDTNHLAVFRWYHLAGTYSQADGIMRLFLDGNEIASRSVGKGGVQTVNADVRVGEAGIKRVPTDGTHDTLPSEFGIDGLIDEVRLYRVALSPSQVAESFKDFDPGPAIRNAPDMQQRGFPIVATHGKFGAVYTHLPYYETWENLFRFGPYPDVVVGFDQLPTKFVFWRGVSYIPMLVNESNQWFTEEFNETGGTAEAPGDCEPMSDKACYDSHVRVLENTPARVVVEWRYRLANPDHHWANYDAATGWGDIADWYFTIYPDGVASVRMRLYTAKMNAWYEWDEQIAVFGEGQHPESIVRKAPVMTLVDATGKATDYDWNPNPPRPKYAGNIIQMIHFTGKFSPFAIQDFNGGDIYSGERTWYSVFPTWNHWPTAQANSSGRNASFPDRAAHSSISHLLWAMYATQRGDMPFQEKVLMEGMTDKPASALTDLAKSWLHAPALEAATDCRSAGYDPAQRAYVFAATGSAPSFRVAASAGQPIVNPGFVVRDWNADTLAQVAVNSVVQPDSPMVRQGITRDPNGRRTLVVWLQREDTTPITVTLRGAKSLKTSAELSPATWAAAPHAVSNTLAVTMTSTPLAGVGNEYLFECTGGPGHSSGWLAEPRYTDAGLPPATELAYRVKARNAYLAETAWSPAEKVRTSAAPPPVVWNLDEGSGTKVSDHTGQHDGAIHGPATWVAGVEGKALHLDGKSYVEVNGPRELHSNGSFTWAASIRTTQGGTIIARAGAGRAWQPGGKVMFVENGRLRFDVGWVGATGAETPVNDGEWHHVAVTVERTGNGNNIHCYVDGRLGGSGSLDVTGNDESRLAVKIGFCNEDFPNGRSAFAGDLDDVRWYAYALSAEQIRELCRRDQAALPARPSRSASLPLASPERGYVSSRPATTWEHALISGNGKYGALVYGQPLDETIVLNHARLFMPLNRPLPPVDTASHLKEIRRMMADGQYQRAADYVVELSHQEGYGGKRWTDPFIPAFDLRVKMAGAGPVGAYARSVDFATGVATVRWRDAGGEFERRLFVSRPDDAVVLSITAPGGGKVSCALRLAKRPTEGQGGWWPESSFTNGIQSVAIAAEASWLTYRSNFRRTWPGSLQGYEGAARIVAKGGTTRTEGDTITVKGANEVLVLLRIALLKDFAASQIPALERGLAAVTPDFSTLLQRHAKEHGALFNRARLDLGGGADRALTSEDLIAKSRVGALLPALLEKEFDAARYAVICSSGELFPNLQGIWNGTWGPPWSADFTQNGNVQSAIAADLSANLAECLLPYFRYQEALLPDSRENARRLYGTRGIQVASRTSSHGLNNHFDQTWPMTFWTAGAGWAAHFFYEYYLYTGDREFLAKRALPFMKEAAAFYEDFLVAGLDGKWLFSPSYSPENNPGNGPSQACINATMDIAVAKELLNDCIAACETLHTDADRVARWRAMLAKMPDYEINADGAVQEWTTPLLTDNYAHRHCSHLYALFDGLPDEIATNAPLRKAFAVAAAKRLEIRERENGGEMAFGLVQLGQAFSSLRDAAHSYEVVDWLANNYWYPNLVTTHNPKSLFNTDLCGGLPAIVIKMLVDSQPGWIELLPALPTEWPKGAIAGIRCRGQIEVRRLAWDGERITVTLRSSVAQTTRLKLAGGIQSIAVEQGPRSALEKIESDGPRVRLPAGREVTFRIQCQPVDEAQPRR